MGLYRVYRYTGYTVYGYTSEKVAFVTVSRAVELFPEKTITAIEDGIIPC